MTESTEATRVAAARLLLAVRDRDYATVSEIVTAGTDLAAMLVWVAEMHVADLRLLRPDDPRRLDRRMEDQLRWAGVA